MRTFHPQWWGGRLLHHTQVVTQPMVATSNSRAAKGTAQHIYSPVITAKYRKLARFPFLLLSTASLRVVGEECQKKHCAVPYYLDAETLDSLRTQGLTHTHTQTHTLWGLSILYSSRLCPYLSYGNRRYVHGIYVFLRPMHIHRDSTLDADACSTHIKSYKYNTLLIVIWSVLSYSRETASLRPMLWPQQPGQ